MTSQYQNAFQERRDTAPRMVYFIRPIGMQGPIKIGCSATPDARLSNLDTWSPFPLEIAASVMGSYRIERRFHALFVEHHQRREWFNWAPQFDEVIAQINAGNFDVEGLPAAIRVTTLHVPRRNHAPDELTYGDVPRVPVGLIDPCHGGDL